MTRQHIDAFTVIGIAERTNNAKGAGPGGVIPKQWQKYFEEGVAENIPNKLGSSTYARYPDYASDHNCYYTFIIGVKVKRSTAPPRGMTASDVLSGRYATLTTDLGPLPQVVP